MEINISWTKTNELYDQWAVPNNKTSFPIALKTKLNGIQ